MAGTIAKIDIFRFDPGCDSEPTSKVYEVPVELGMSVMDALDYIYHHLDSTLAYYDHAACSLGICGKCTGRINGRPRLFCQTLLEGDTILEPLSKENVLKDLVMKKKEDRGV